MSESINTKYNANTKLTQEMIMAKQQPYQGRIGAIQTHQKDVVEINNKKEKPNKLKKWGIICAAIGTAALATVGIVLGKNKLDAKKLEKLEAEARRVAEEARQKAYEAEEKARIEAEEKLQAQRKAEAEARQKAKLEAEAKAKAEAEAKEKARLEAEKIAQGKVINEAKVKGQEEITGIIGFFNKNKDSKLSKFYNTDGTLNFDALLKPENLLKPAEAPCGKFDTTYYLLDCLKKRACILSEHDVSEQIIKQIREMETSSLTYEQIKEVLSKSKRVSESEIEILKKAAGALEVRIFDMECRLRANNEKMDYLIGRLSHEKPKEGESSADFISGVIKDFEDKKATERQKHLRSVHSKIKYTDEPCIEYFADDPNYVGPNVVAAEAYARSETSGYKDNADFIKKFSTFPRYRSKAKGAIADEYNGILPLVRWIESPCKPCTIDPVSGYRTSELHGWRTVHDFANQFKVGEEYSVPMRQSCSKSFSSTYGDYDFCDYAPTMDVKMIFVPKSRNGSRAVDLLNNGYKGHSDEAIYLPGEKFIVLDKRIEEVESPYRKPGESGRSIYRWVIEMQEK